MYGRMIFLQIFMGCLIMWNDLHLKAKQNVEVEYTITPTDFGKAFAEAYNDEQAAFLEAIVTEFNNFECERGNAGDMQLLFIAETLVKHSEHASDVRKWLVKLANFIEYEQAKKEFVDKEEHV